MQLLQRSLLLLELGDGVFWKGEDPNQHTDFVIQGLEVGWGTLSLGIFLGAEGRGTCSKRRSSAWLHPRVTWGPGRCQCPANSGSRDEGAARTPSGLGSSTAGPRTAATASPGLSGIQPLGHTRPAGPESASCRGPGGSCAPQCWRYPGPPSLAGGSHPCETGRGTGAKGQPDSTRSWGADCRGSNCLFGQKLSN